MFPKQMPRFILPLIGLLAVLSFVPLGAIAVNRATPQKTTRISIIPDMDKQQKFLPQSRNNMFRDGRGMRPQLAGTVPYQHSRNDDHLYRGIVGSDWATTYPLQPSAAMMQRGEERYTIYCSVCHGASGYGNGMVNQRAQELQEGTWVQPKSLHDPLVRERPIGHIFNSISNGIRTMPAYGPQIPVEDRWAIVLYVRALQRSQHASLSDLSSTERAELELRRGELPPSDASVSMGAGDAPSNAAAEPGTSTLPPVQGTPEGAEPPAAAAAAGGEQ